MEPRRSGAGMAIKAEGTALIGNASDGTLHEIGANLLEWEVIGSEENSMGPEVLHMASIDHPDLGEISWTISEYPAGSVNHVTAELNGHLILEDFHFWYKHEREDDLYPTAIREPIEFSTKDFAGADVEKQRDMLVAWFTSRYEDPAQETPYNGREGGYQYIFGGPYDAREELSENFSEIVSDEVIEAAVEEVESDGTSEWAPIQYGYPDEGDEHYEPRKIAHYGQLLNAGASARPDNDEIVAAKIEALTNTEAFLAVVRAVRPKHGGPGHNGPPVDEAGNILPPGFYDELEAAAEEMGRALAQEEPDLPQVARAGAILERRLSWIVKPRSAPIQPSKDEVSNDTGNAKTGKFSEGFAEQMGKNAADIVTNVVVAGASLAGGFVLNTILPGLDILVGSLITYLTLKIRH